MFQSSALGVDIGLSGGVQTAFQFQLAGLQTQTLKAMVDGAPKAILEKAKKEDAEKAKSQLEEAGATVELK